MDIEQRQIASYAMAGATELLIKIITGCEMIGYLGLAALIVAGYMLILRSWNDWKRNETILRPVPISAKIRKKIDGSSKRINKDKI